jgi:hypothetical protein
MRPWLVAWSHANRVGVSAVNNIGHIAFERRGHDLRLRCNHCGSEEVVADFDTGGRPRRFGLSPLGSGDPDFAKCHHCLMVHNRAPDDVPAIRSQFRFTGLK